MVKAFWLGVGMGVGGAEQGRGNYWGLEDESRHVIGLCHS